ncbi:MAG TPA: histidine kinase [Chitinophagaceae bacterium]|nr:histidine kinase [Chitinophagaceae bacterium]
MSRNTRYWLFQLGGWGLFSLINIFFAYSFDKMGTQEEQQKIYFRLLVFVAAGFLLSHVMRYIIIGFNLLQKRLEQQLVGFLVVTLLFAFVASTLENLLLMQFNLQNKTERAFNDNFFLLVLSGAFSVFILFFIWNLIYFMYHFITKSQRQQLDTLKLESLVKELELKTIKAHINPHFIFNSLNGIRALIDEDPARARNSITELSNILRSSMQTDKLESVSLEKELNIVKDYLALENMRFEDRLRVEYEIDEDTLDQPVPPMMLQTLVENAIKHGISKQISGGKIKIVSDFRDSYHELAVQNTGKLVNGTARGEGFGLPSTLNRLSLLYGEKARFSIKQLTSEIVEARVMLPVQMSI